MWSLYLTAKTTASRPSELLNIEDKWAAYQLDEAVVLFGTIIENALMQQVNRGTRDEPRYESKYTLQQLLTPGFVIESEQDTVSDTLDDLSGVAGIVADAV